MVKISDREPSILIIGIIATPLEINKQPKGVTTFLRLWLEKMKFQSKTSSSATNREAVSHRKYIMIGESSFAKADIKFHQTSIFKRQSTSIKSSLWI
jgi:hypothetical protein